MVTTIIALLFAGVAFIVWEQNSTRHTMTQDLSMQAAMIAENCKAALSFNDVNDAETLLKSLHVKSSVVFGGIYNKKGDIFASYNNNNGYETHPAKLDQSGSYSDNALLTVFQPIILEGETIGTVCLQSDWKPLYTMRRHTTNIIIAVLLFASVAAYLISSRIQRIISSPLLNLADLANNISEKKDYTARAKKETNDEVGLLIDAFNEMLEQIQKRDSELVDSKKQLEVRVEERTADLKIANTQLQKEVEVRKKAEAKQAALLEEINGINQELKSFAYVVSHDLKAPLRGISTLAEWISTDYADKIDKEGQEQLKLLLNRVERMHKLIDGILQYSRIGRVHEEKASINLNELVKDVAEMIAPPPHIKITVENELPTIVSGPTRIAQVFQNLLSNAVKYMDKPKGLIKITCAEEKDFWKFGVVDNGPGIEEKHFERIFQIFQTLSSKEETDSTGIGLTVVKKIVETYGGKIWVESKVGAGSTFYFTLPRQETRVTEDEKLQTNIVS